MKIAAILATLAAGFTVAGCSSEPAGPIVDSAASSIERSASNPNATPISYVSTFSGFLGIDVRTNGNSGRSRENDLVLTFDVTGDLVGTALADLTNNNGIDKVGFATSHQDAVLDVCWSARGLCGTFRVKSAGKITGEGIDFPISIGHGTGDFEGMTLRGELVECPDSVGDKGCFSGYMVE